MAVFCQWKRVDVLHHKYVVGMTHGVKRVAFGVVASWFVLKLVASQNEKKACASLVLTTKTCKEKLEKGAILLLVEFNLKR